MSKENDRCKMKILLVSPLPNKYSFGGIASWTRRFVDGMANDKNVDVMVVDANPINKKGNNEFGLLGFIKKSFFNLRLISKVKKEIGIFKPDIVHLNTSCTPLACLRDFFILRIARKRKKICVLHCRCNVEDQITKSRVGFSIFKKNICRASAVFVLNRRSFEFVGRCKDDSNSALFIIPNFIDESIVSNEKNINEDLKKAIFVGHLVKNKGIDEIIFLATVFPGVHFEIVSSFMRDYPNGDVFPTNVSVTGKLSQESVIKELDGADAFLFPSHSEGFSNALLEAMARGVPAIATDVGANLEMLENRGGFTFKTGDKSEVREKFAALFKQKTREDMSSWNIKKVKNSYVSGVVLKRIIDVYSLLLEKHE